MIKSISKEISNMNRNEAERYVFYETDKRRHIDNKIKLGYMCVYR